MKLLKNKLVLLSFFTVLSSLLFWLIFYFNLPQVIGFPEASLETVYSNYDGPNYIAISKCGYDKDCIARNYSLPLPLEYYPAHFPGYPMIIKILSFFTLSTKAMLLATLFGSILLSIYSYKLFCLFVKPKHAYWLTLILLFFPPRLFVLRQIGAPETWFIGSIVASVFYFKKKNYLPSAIFAALAQSIKTPGALLALSYLFIAIKNLRNSVPLKNIISKYIYYLLVPATVLLIFFIYQQQLGNFFAYFQSGDNHHLYPLPYIVFVSNLSWIGSIWLEEIIYILLIVFYGLYLLQKRYKLNIVFIFPLIFTIATIFVGHRDISRYISPVYPFMLLAFYKLLNRRPLKIILFLLLPAVILYGINFVIGNTAPIASWAPYL